MQAHIDDAVGLGNLGAVDDISGNGVVVKPGQISGTRSAIGERTRTALIKIAQRTGLVRNGVGQSNVTGIRRAKLLVAIPVGVIGAVADGAGRSEEGTGVESVIIV